MSKEKVKDYRKRIHRYLSSMRFCKDLYDNRFISFEAYVEIEKRLAEKYGIEENSLFRIKINKNVK